MLLRLMALVSVVVHMVSAQDRNNVLRQGGSQNTRSEIATSRSRAFLSCENGDMVVTVNFTQPFRGLIYAHRSRNSPCKVQGYGDYHYVLRIPLKGCGTWQESPRVFVNNITIRFHPALELEEDETKTIVCRYPPPLTPSPGGIYIMEQTTPLPSGAKIQAAKLSEVEILIIICLLLFLSLLTLGIGIAYFCLKRRNIHLVRRKPLSSGPASQLTKLSASTPQQPSQLSGTILGHTVRIPRVVPYSASLRTPTHQDSTKSPVISRDSLESTPSTSTTSGDSEGTELLRNSSLVSRRNLTIPKAVLRKRDFNRSTLPHVHQRSFPAAVSTTNGKHLGEFEDQTITTVLEPEYTDYSNQEKKEFGLDTTAFPVYAQVDKKRQRVKIDENKHVMHLNESEHKFQESGLRHTKEVPIQTKAPKQEIADENAYDGHTNKGSNLRLSKTASHHSKAIIPLQQNQHLAGREKLKPVDKSFYSKLLPHSRSSIIPEEKTLYVHDISDVYVTTTVETESTETRTTLSRDIIEQHVKDNKRPLNSKGNSTLDNGKTTDFDLASKVNTFDKQLPSSQLDPNTPRVLTKSVKCKDDIVKTYRGAHDTDLKDRASPSLSKTENWNVVIRQRKSSLQNADELEREAAEESVDILPELPKFKVKIRALPPNTKQGDSSADILKVPHLQMPHSIEKIRNIMSHLEPSRESHDNRKSEISKGKMGSTSQPSKTVWWPDNPNPTINMYSPEPGNSSDSSHSETSLRERSSSEVLEKAPVLISPKKHASTLERSTSEIVSTPENYSTRNKNVPVFESFSPEFLANIPVTKGGFFNEPSTPEKSNKAEKKLNSSSETWYI